MQGKCSRIKEKVFGKAVISVGKRINEQFISCYLELERDCCEKFGVTTDGITEYINRLNNARFAPNRDDALPRLVRYRNIRNKFTHEVGALRRSDEITKADMKWLRSFDRDIVRNRDPISLYLKKARKTARQRRVRHFFYVGAIVVIAVLTILLAIALNN